MLDLRWKGRWFEIHGTLYPLLSAGSTQEDCFNLYVPVNNFPAMSGRVFLGLTNTKQRIKWLAQGHNTVPPVRIEPAIPRSPGQAL